MFPKGQHHQEWLFEKVDASSRHPLTTTESQVDASARHHLIVTKSQDDTSFRPAEIESQEENEYPYTLSDDKKK